MTNDNRRFVGGAPPSPDGTISAADRRHIAGVYPFARGEVALCGTLTISARHDGACVTSARHDGVASVLEAC